MTVRLVRAPTVDPGPPHDGTLPARWVCAFVNNMPDGAFDATERQYLELLEAGSGDEVVEVRRFTMPDVPRGDRTAARIAEEYLPFETVREGPPDLLIVTGSNPLAPRIEDEPYWEDLAALLSWGREHIPSMLLSCLSAHAALVVFDGIERTTLDTKCTGVFPQRALPHPLADGLGPPLVLPHSRLNTVGVDQVVAAGYEVVLQSDAVGWSVVTKATGRCRVVLVQGHPEYDPSSLLREYHRDARRYVLHERDDVPCLPLCCVAPGDWEQLRLLHQRIVAERDPELVESFPFDEVGDRAEWPWRDAAVGLYTNWMAAVTKRSD
ncbi:MAG: homoserine O-succinyltransferase [Acidimicrobiales bacterium]